MRSFRVGLTACLWAGIPGAEDKRHVVDAHSDGYEERNRANGHPEALEPDPEIQGDPMVRANLDAVAAGMSDDLSRAERIHRHEQEVRRRGAA